MLQLFTYVFDNSAFINRAMLTIHRRSRLVIEVVMLRWLLLEVVLVLMYRQNHLAASAEPLELRLELNLLHSIPLPSKQIFASPPRLRFFNDYLTHG